MIETALMDYGVMGVFVLTLLTALRYMVKKDEKRDEALFQIVTNNTVALSKFNETTKKCEVKK